MTTEWKSLAELETQKLENETIDRLFLNSSSGLVSVVTPIFDIDWVTHIQCIRIPHNYIDSSEKGDIDMAFIPADFSKITLEGGLNIFHDLTLDFAKACATEIKVMVWHEDIHSEELPVMKTKKFSHGKREKARQQARRNLEMGFAQSLLTYIVIAKAPKGLDGSGGISHWIYSSELASNGIDAATVHQDENHRIRAEENDEFGTAIFGIGTIEGAYEAYKGSMTHKILQNPTYWHESNRNSFIKKFKKIITEEIENHKGKIATQFRNPPRFPVIRACSNDRCRKIYLSLNLMDNCPVCDSNPT